jgi:pilus assembly protein CpaD
MRYVILAALIFVAGCDSYYVGDYRERFPIIVQRDAPVLLVSFLPNRAELAAEEARRVDAFLADYVARNSGPLRLTAQRVGTADRLALDRLAALESRALAAGIPKASIELGLGDTGSRTADAVATFERFTAQVPECGDWTKSTSDDWTNSPSSNFGCATQRYVGLMAADPQDLLRARALGSHDNAKLADTLGKYRTGQPTVATPQEPTAWKDYFNPTVGAGGAQQ